MSKAVTCYINALQADPNDEEAYQSANYVLHEKLFQFQEAFTLNQQWVTDHPDTSAKCDFAEKYFTTGRFAECKTRLADLLTDSEFEPSAKIALRAINVANVLALNKPKQIPTQLDTLQAIIISQFDTFKVGWTFEGTKHFISQNEALAPYCEWLLQLFQALELKTGREAILAVLTEVRKNWLALSAK